MPRTDTDGDSVAFLPSSTSHPTALVLPSFICLSDPDPYAGVTSRCRFNTPLPPPQKKKLQPHHRQDLSCGGNNPTASTREEKYPPRDLDDDPSIRDNITLIEQLQESRPASEQNEICVETTVLRRVRPHPPCDPTLPTKPPPAREPPPLEPVRNTCRQRHTRGILREPRRADTRGRSKRARPALAQMPSRSSPSSPDPPLPPPSSPPSSAGSLIPAPASYGGSTAVSGSPSGA